MDLLHQPKDANVRVHFQGTGVLHCYLIPTPQFETFAAGGAVDCFQFEVAPLMHAIQIPREGPWRLAMTGTGEVEVEVGEPLPLAENVRAILQPEKSVDPTTDNRAATLNKLPFRSDAPKPGQPGFIGPVAVQPQQPARQGYSQSEREMLRRFLLSTGTPVNQVDKQVEAIIERASIMPVPKAENYQPGDLGPDITPEKFIEGFFGRGVDALKANWELMKNFDPLVMPVRAIIDPEGTANDQYRTLHGLAPLVGAGGDNAPGVGESWKNVGKDAISYEEWTKGNPAKAAGQNAFDALSIIAGGRGIANALRATERLVPERGGPVVERATPTLLPAHNFIPQKAYDVLELVDKGQWPGAAKAPGTKGGGTYRNKFSEKNGVDNVRLPFVDGSGSKIVYKEWDVNPIGTGGRDAERIVTGSDGSAYYTSDHYGSFIKIR